MNIIERKQNKHGRYMMQKLQVFRETFKDRGGSIVVCVRCGSALVDQNSLAELKCYTCGNTLAWDGDKFTIYKGSERDILPAFKRTGLEVSDNILRDEPLEGIYMSASCNFTRTLRKNETPRRSS
jgi:hypothetical protein